MSRGFIQFDPEWDDGDGDYSSYCGLNHHHGSLPDYLYPTYRYVSTSEFKASSDKINKTSAMKEYSLSAKDMESLQIRGTFKNPHPGGAEGKLYLRADCRKLAGEKAKKKTEAKEKREQLAREKDQRKADREKKRELNELGSPSKSPSKSPFKSPRKTGASNRVAPYDTSSPSKRKGRPRKEEIGVKFESDDGEEGTDGQALMNSGGDQDFQKETLKIEPGSERRSSRAKRINYAGLD